MAKLQSSVSLLAILCLAAILIPQTSLADEAWVTVFGGSVQLRDGQGIEISMASEIVRILLKPHSYTVDASFEFINSGKTATVTVGFPMIETAGVVSHVENFQTWVNGERVKFNELPAVVLDSNGEKPATDQSRMYGVKVIEWMVKKVTFPENAKTITRVSYSAPYGTFSDPMDDRFVEYVFGTGNSWKGPIGKATFIIQTSPGIWILRKPWDHYHSGPPFQFSRLGGNEWEYVLTNFKPKSDDKFFFDVSSKTQPWARVLGNAHRVDGSDCHSTGTSLGFWEYSKFTVSPVSDELLETLSLDQLRLFRNSFYAYHGKIFESKDLIEFFKKDDCYRPDPNFDESQLNATEKANIDKISAYEKELIKLKEAQAKDKTKK